MMNGYIMLTNALWMEFDGQTDEESAREYLLSFFVESDKGYTGIADGDNISEEKLFAWRDRIWATHLPTATADRLEELNDDIDYNDVESLICFFWNKLHKHIPEDAEFEETEID